MKYIEAPKELNEDHGVSVPAIFLAGGITDCPDFQKEMVEKLKDQSVLY